MPVKLPPDQFVQPDGACFTVERCGLLSQQSMQALARGKYAHGQTWRQPAGAFRGGKITLQVIIGGFLLAETAQSGDSRFLIVGKKVGIKASCG
jgi:hypothetical protein